MKTTELDETPMIGDRPMYYRLDAEHNVHPANRRQFIELAEGGDAPRRVAKTTVGDTDVSTVFLMLDHGYLRSGPPVLFETMIFGGDHDGEQWRYSTWVAAEAGHARIVAALEAGEDPDS